MSFTSQLEAAFLAGRGTTYKNYIPHFETSLTVYYTLKRLR